MKFMSGDSGACAARLKRSSRSSTTFWKESLKMPLMLHSTSTLGGLLSCLVSTKLSTALRATLSTRVGWKNTLGEEKNHLTHLWLGFDGLQAVPIAVRNHINSLWGQALAKVGFQHETSAESRVPANIDKSGPHSQKTLPHSQTQLSQEQAALDQMMMSQQRRV
ncbi:MAG: hypothetical protein FRX49_01824 [Trebouxia sp. A1-2]|nr:MAG: hypothetical protein FRX49_01824 [Trebouxia sp. A1-2]